LAQTKDRILFVDDQESDRYVVGRLLRREGFEVKEAATGKETLRLAMEIPDLIILDIRLPDLNGFEICRQLKSSPLTREIPLLLLTATYHDDQSRLKGFECGADGYLTQPIEPAVLVAHIKALLRSQKALRESESRYRMIIDGLRTGVYIIQDEKIQFVNERFAEMMESKKEELVGTASADIVQPEDREFLQKETARSLSGVEPSRGFEIRLTCKGGKIRRVEAFDTVIEYKGGPAVLRNLVEMREREGAEDHTPETMGQ
jgi:PAS domain S-box-containing protein